MHEQARGEIAMMVRTGFYDHDELVAMFCEERYAPGELDERAVAAAITRATRAFEEEQAGWPDVTDCDRLDRAFAALRDDGVVALQNAGYTQRDGYDDVLQVVQLTTDRTRLIGYCYYHGQDLERAVAGHGLHLAFGPLDALEEQTRGIAVGRLIVAELARQGLDVAWDGTFEQRIAIPHIVWRRRQQGA